MAITESNPVIYIAGEHYEEVTLGLQTWKNIFDLVGARRYPAALDSIEQDSRPPKGLILAGGTDGVAGFLSFVPNVQRSKGIDFVNRVICYGLTDDDRELARNISGISIMQGRYLNLMKACMRLLD